jgi:hypothetical protein
MVSKSTKFSYERKLLSNSNERQCNRQQVDHQIEKEMETKRVVPHQQS